MLNYVNLALHFLAVIDDTSTPSVAEPPQWLDSQEMRIWRGFLEASGRISTAINEQMKRHGDLTSDDYEVLVHLSEAEPAQLRMTELSHRLLHSQSRLTQRVDRLVKRGLVCREKCPDDRRGTFAVLTADGLALIQELAPRHLCDVREMLIDLIEPDERELLVTVFERLAQHAREHDSA